MKKTSNNITHVACPPCCGESSSGLFSLSNDWTEWNFGVMVSICNERKVAILARERNLSKRATFLSSDTERAKRGKSKHTERKVST